LVIVTGRLSHPLPASRPDGLDRLGRVTDADRDPASVVRRWVERVWNEADDSKRSHVLRDLHPVQILNEGSPSSPDQLAAWHASMRETYPDLHYAVDELVAAGERVTLRWTATGTQRGSLWGILPPTGRTVSWHGVHLVTVHDAQIVEVWAAANVVDVLQQLGVRLLPADPAAD
jgi:steroid delta-isomerase-like uncharacterized protein